MGISENFLVNTDSFDPIIKALVEREDHPKLITDQMLEEMGYTNPSDLLVMHVLRGLEIINEEKQPTDLYFKMVDPDTTKEAIAEGLFKGYGELFEREPEIHKMTLDGVRNELKDYFGDKKTDLIIKYIANTFQKLISYAGFKNVEKARIAYLEKKSIPVESTATAHDENGPPDISDTITQDSVKSRSMEEILFGDTPSEEIEETEAKQEQSGEEAPATENQQEPEEEIEKETREEQAKVSEKEQIPEEPEAAPRSEQEEEQAEVNESETEEAPSFESEIHEYRPEDDDEDEQLEMNEETAEAEKTKPIEERKPAVVSKLDLSSRKVQKAIIRRANLQYKLEYYPEALESVEQILSYFEDADEAFLKDAVKNAVVRRVDILNKLDKQEDLLPALNEVINRFSDSANEHYHHKASMAMLQKAELLEQRDYDREDLLPLYDSIIERLEDSSDPTIQDKVTNIFAKRLELLEQSGGRSEYLEALGTSIVRFQDARRYRKYLEEAMFRKAELLERMDRSEEALDAYNAFLEEFGQAIEI